MDSNTANNDCQETVNAVNNDGIVTNRLIKKLETYKRRREEGQTKKMTERSAAIKFATQSVIS